MATESTLHNPAVQATLQRLQRAATRDWQVLPRLLPRLLKTLLRRQSWESAFDSESMRECYIPVAPELGKLLYLTARQLHAKHIAEFGTSFR